jgi:hypothetical protein
MRDPDSLQSFYNAILHKAETRTYLVFFVLLSVWTLLFVSTQRSGFHDAVLTILVSFSLFFLCNIAVTQFKHLVIPKLHVDPKGKAVFVTGCASGFGKQLVTRLDTLGFTVFAGVRSVGGDPRVKELLSSCSKRVSLVQVDVTDQEQVNQAAAVVERSLSNTGERLWALVSNAGVYSCQGFDWGPQGIREYERIMDCNTFGTVRVVKAFTPLLKKTKDSRIVINSSISSEYW